VAVPSFFIVGAPRSGTSSLFLYLASHPRVFACTPKEPHHFGGDLDIRWRPFADRQAYLALFAGAGPTQIAGEASVFYLYSHTAPSDILALNPEARVIVMVRNPVDMICSLHAHNRFIGYEDRADLEAALDAEAERREGRGIPAACVAPVSLQYSALVEYTEHIVRYRSAFGADRVKTIVFDDLEATPAVVYGETLAFLGLEPGGAGEFRVHNSRQRWRSQWIGDLSMRGIRTAQRASLRVRSPRLRAAASAAVTRLMRVHHRLNCARGEADGLDPALRRALQARFKPAVDRVSNLLGRELWA
jgi:sulfotransferase family protein